MLSVFKLVSCKPGASRELDLRPQSLRSSLCSKLIFSNIIVVREKFDFLLFSEVIRAANPPDNDREGM